MKATFEAEDAVIGIICGLLLIGYTGHFFSLKLNNYVYVGAFAVFIIFILIDLACEFHDLTTHFGLIVFSIVHNLIDLVLSLGFISPAFVNKSNSSLIMPFLSVACKSALIALGFKKSKICI